MRIDERIYHLDDQESFAALSGDHNPIHIDPTSARRDMWGAIVVHGVHAMLDCLESYLGYSGHDGPAEIAELEVRFIKPIYTDEPVSIRIDREEAETAWLEIASQSGDRLATIKVQLTARAASDDACGSLSMPTSEPPRELSFADLVNDSGIFEFAVDEEAVREKWPALFSVLGRDQIVDIVSLTRLVGMKCPGLRSIFAGFHLAANPTAAKEFRYRVSSADERFSRLDIAIQGRRFSGGVETFFRPLPSLQLTMDAAKKKARSNEFKGFNAWIIGGSRGIGEAAAKLIAAGGGMPVITYRMGKDDAKDIADQIRSSGFSCGVQKLDISEAEAAFTHGIEKYGLPNAVLYFASPKIFIPKSTQFDRAVFDHFVDYYIDGMDKIYRLIRNLEPRHSLVWFHPSSSAIEEPVKGLAEYTAAKAAAEVFLNHIDRFDKHTSVLQARLPRITTDQTTTLMPFPAENADDVMLPVLRKLHRLLSSHA